MMDPEKIIDAVAEAERELCDVASQLETLQQQLQKIQQRASELQRFIALGKALLEEPAAEDNQLSGDVEEPLANDESGQSPTRPSAADYARELLEQVQRPMKVADIAKELMRKGLVQGRWAREVLRAGMDRREDFECVRERRLCHGRITTAVPAASGPIPTVPQPYDSRLSG